MSPDYRPGYRPDYHPDYRPGYRPEYLVVYPFNVLQFIINLILSFLVEILFTIIKMVYPICQLHSREAEQTLRANIPDYDEFRKEVQRDNMESFKKRQKEINKARSQKLVSCENCKKTVKYYSLSNHRKSKNVEM